MPSLFFQAEDGIRDTSVTGVQTCALPICPSRNIFHTPTHELGVRDVLCQMNGMLNRRCMRVDARDSKTVVRERKRQKGTVATTHVEHPQRGRRTSWKGLAKRVADESQTFAVTPMIFGHCLLGCGKESHHFLESPDFRFCTWEGRRRKPVAALRALQARCNCGWRH